MQPHLNQDNLNQSDGFNQIEDHWNAYKDGNYLDEEVESEARYAEQVQQIRNQVNTLNAYNSNLSNLEVVRKNKRQISMQTQQSEIINVRNQISKSRGNSNSPMKKNEEVKIQRSEESPQYKNEQIGDDECPRNQVKQQKFSIRARQVMEEVYGVGGSQSPQKTSQLESQRHQDLVEIRLFKKSVLYKALEQASLIGEDLKIKEDNQEKFDLDSDEGQRICKNYLSCIERLFDILQIQVINKDYRSKFTRAYKVLYQDGQICFLPEILDSAQEGFQYLWVNGEKYVFSEDVIDASKSLFSHFLKIKTFIAEFAKQMGNEDIKEMLIVNKKKSKLMKLLKELDEKWSNYEKCYVFELMVIEIDARRNIVEAIKIEQKMTEFELANKQKGLTFIQTHQTFNELRTQLLKNIGEVNSVANVNGKGRSDFGIDLLIKAEEIQRKGKETSCKAVKKMTDSVKITFHTFRVLLRKYNENIEVVDPQLKNNQELVEVLGEFEKSWTLGKEYLLSPLKFQNLVQFSNIIESAIEKHKGFAEQVEVRDAEIFISIPNLLVLKLLEDDESSINISKKFCPALFQEGHQFYLRYQELKEEYSKAFQKLCGNQFIIKSNGRSKSREMKKGSIQKNKQNHHDFYNDIEKIVIGDQFDQSKLNEYKKIQQLIMNLGIEIQRCSPSEWNEFMIACLGSN